MLLKNAVSHVEPIRTLFPSLKSYGYFDPPWPPRKYPLSQIMFVLVLSCPCGSFAKFHITLPGPTSCGSHTARIFAPFECDPAPVPSHIQCFGGEPAA